MDHDILGEIEQNDDDGTATIAYDSRQIEVRMMPDDQPFETTVALAAEVVKRLKELDKIAKQTIVADLRETYNDGWNEYDKAQEDGSLKSVTNPQLSAAEFEKKFSLSSVNVTSDAMIDFFYNDSGLFWGHSVRVSSMNGIDFSEANAELLG